MSNSSVESSPVIEKIHHRAVIADYVTDAITGRAIVGTEVEVVESNMGAKTKTREDGFFYFLDLPNKQYDLSFLVPQGSRSCYGRSYNEPTARVPDVTVQSEPNGRLDGKPIFDLKAHVALYPTRLVGSVKRSEDQNKVIANAIVKLHGSDVQALTDKDGKYLLSGFPAGTYTIQVSAKDIATQTQLVRLTTGKETTAEDFLLQLSARLIGQVTSKDTDKPIALAIVQLVDSQLPTLILE